MEDEMEAVNMSVDASNLLKGTGFRPASQIKVRQRLIINVQGKEDTGKTHFLLNCPYPLAYFDFDHNAESLLSKPEFADKEIMISPYYFSKPTGKSSDADKILKEASSLWDRFSSEFRQALDECATVALDTSAQVWEMLRMSRFGKHNVLPHHYGALNAEFSSTIFDQAKQSNCNLILSSPLAKQFVNDKETGLWVRQGWSQLDYKVQYSLELEKVKVGPNKGKFQGKIFKFKPDPDVIGQVIINPSFNDIFERAFPKGV
tara:strand:+ start:1538 stop:2317 length:780 start_codon:yes stop_codon:yes gene_type:complete